jgi:hypothetical protein
MRTYFYAPVSVLALLLLCLMFAPSRRVIGDRLAFGSSVPEVPQLPTEPRLSPGDTTKSFAELCATDPVGALSHSLQKYQKEVEGYTCTFIKQDRLKGDLKATETIDCEFQQYPYSILMRWKQGTGRAESTLYVTGENDNQLLIIPSSSTQKAALKLLGKRYAKRDVNSSDVLEAARYPANHFGFHIATLRVYEAWKAALDREELQVEYRGLLPVAELDGKICHVLHRICVHPEEEGLTDVTLYLDPVTHFQVGADLRENGNIIGRYYFKNVKLNPKFQANHFAAENFQ